MKSIKSIYIKAIFVFISILFFFAMAYILNKPIEGDVPTAARKRFFAKAQVSQMLNSDASPDVWTEGLSIGMQEAIVTIKSGQHKGEELSILNYLSAYGNVNLKEGTRIIVNIDYDEQNNPYVVYIVNYDRSVVIILLVVVFIGLLVTLGGKKGVAAVLGLAFNIFSIWFLLIPLLKRGFPSIPSAVLIVALATSVSLLLLNGFSKKTFCAAIGCIGGVAIAGIVAFIAGKLTPINGFNMGEAEELVLRASDSGLRISGLLVSGILISSLGAVMDISMSVVSPMAEIHEINPKISRKDLFKSGINIGRDTMGTMANTLILAFAGASLNMLILFRIFDYPSMQVFNSDLMTIEIIQGLSGSIGIVLTVPLVSVLTAFIYTKKKKSQITKR